MEYAGDAVHQRGGQAAALVVADEVRRFLRGEEVAVAVIAEEGDLVADLGILYTGDIHEALVHAARQQRAALAAHEHRRVARHELFVQAVAVADADSRHDGILIQNVLAEVGERVALAALLDVGEITAPGDDLLNVAERLFRMVHIEPAANAHGW